MSIFSPLRLQSFYFLNNKKWFTTQELKILKDKPYITEVYIKVKCNFLGIIFFYN